MATFNEMINSDKPVLVDFCTDWCSPCKAMTPILEQLKNMIGDTAKIIKINVEKNSGVANKYQVNGVPTLIIFKKGDIKWRQSGVVPADHLKKLVDICI